MTADAKRPLSTVIEDAATLPSLDAARRDPAGVVILEGDYGGQIYVVARAAEVRCDDAALRALLAELDAVCWDDPEGACVAYERRAIGAPIVSGMGGAVSPERIWIHRELDPLSARIEAVLFG